MQESVWESDFVADPEQLAIDFSFSDRSGLGLFDSLDASDIFPDETTTNSSPQDARENTNLTVSIGLKVEWHKCESVLGRVLGILQSCTCPDGVRMFPSNPDYETLRWYYGDNRDIEHALYVVHTTGANFSDLVATSERRTNDWGNAIGNHPRFHLVAGKWISNTKITPPNTTATLLCRGGDYRKALLKHPFERLLKPWRYGISPLLPPPQAPRLSHLSPTSPLHSLSSPLTAPAHPGSTS
jgi:hypothetical protein